VSPIPLSASHPTDWPPRQLGRISRCDVGRPSDGYERGNTEGLFRGAFMESGAVNSVGDSSLLQQDYDYFVQETGCAGADDTLECLRQAPFSVLKAAMDSLLNLAWGPRADGAFLEAPHQQLVLQGSVADIPFVIGNKTTYSLFPIVLNLVTPGNCDDEGTLFSLDSFNVT
jgi:acetylcholinesterase